MKLIIRLLLILCLGLQSCIDESCKTCIYTVTYDDIVQEDMSSEIEYCDEQLFLIENSDPLVQYGTEFTITTTVTCN